MELVLHHDVAAFVARAGAMLGAHEAHNNLILGICAELERNVATYGAEPPVLATVEGDGEVALAALQTPPHRLILSHTGRPDAPGLLAAMLADAGARLPGVLGPRLIAERFAQAWAARCGCQVAPGTGQRIYQLTAVRPPAPAPGAMRWAGESDRALLEAWLDAFHREALSGQGLSSAREAASRWLSSPTRALAIWEDGAPAAMAGATGPTPRGIRIGAVYTPPGRRRRGYASALVAALSQAQLDAGRQRCFLYTDLGNPTSNHIYQQIGYAPVVDIAELHFIPVPAYRDGPSV